VISITLPPDFLSTAATVAFSAKAAIKEEILKGHLKHAPHVTMVYGRRGKAPAIFQVPIIALTATWKDLFQRLILTMMKLAVTARAATMVKSPKEEATIISTRSVAANLAI
jgi:hypothetical protein